MKHARGYVRNDAVRAEKAAELVCKGCGKPLLPENLDPATRRMTDGCPCNSPRGINHGLVPVNICACPICDPAQTGSTRPEEKIKFKEWL